MLFHVILYHAFDAMVAGVAVGCSGIPGTAVEAAVKFSCKNRSSSPMPKTC